MTLTATRLPGPRATATQQGRVPAPTTPLLTVDLATVTASYDALQAALPGVQLHYAVKANPSPMVLRTLARAGARWDVASPGEIDLVLEVDPDPSHLSYGNTVKKAADIAYAFSCGVRTFVVDSDRELAKVSAHAPGSEVLVRISTSGRGADWALGAKFGCGEADARRLLLEAVAAGHPVGVSFHVGSQQRDVHAWDEPLAATARLRDAVRHVGSDLSTVDLGGGFPATTQVATAPIETYGLTIVDAIATHLGPDLPRVIAEPGRFLVADAGELESEVVLVTERGGARWVYLDIGLYGGLAETMGEALRYRMTAYRDSEPVPGPVGGVVLAGPTCDSTDVLYTKHRPLLPLDLREGDRVVLHATGAYTTAYSSVGFNGFAPLREVDR